MYQLQCDCGSYEFDYDCDKVLFTCKECEWKVDEDEAGKHLIQVNEGY